MQRYRSLETFDTVLFEGPEAAGEGLVPVSAPDDELVDHRAAERRGLLAREEARVHRAPGSPGGVSTTVNSPGCGKKSLSGSSALTWNSMEWPASGTSSCPKVFAHRDYNDEGQNIDVPSVSVCVHSDTPGAARLAEAIVRKRKENDIEICPSDAPNRRFSNGSAYLGRQDRRSAGAPYFLPRPRPRERSLREEGDEVSTGDVIRFIEVMKSSNEVQVEENGKISKFLAASEEAVDGGQDLVVLE